MTDRYFDWYNGSDSNDGLSSSTPKKSYDAYRAAGNGISGDTFYIKRGTPQITTTAFIGAKVGVSNEVRTQYKAYGESQVPYSIWTNPSGVGNMILNVSGLSNIDFEDMYFDGQGVCQYSLYMFANGATANSNHRVIRCYFTGMALTGSGLVIGGTATSTGDTSNYEILHSHFFRNPTHGLLINGAHDVQVKWCKFYGNGYDTTTGGHGFSAKARRTDATSGWTSPGANRIWQRTLAAHETTVYRVSTSVSLYRRLNENTSTPTTPAKGEFGQSGGLLYINVDSTSNPSSQSVNYSWGRCYNLFVEDNEAYGNIADPRTPSTEGHGFAADDYTESAVIKRNYSHHNDGAAFSVNKGDDNIIESNVGHGNGLPGLVVASAWRPSVVKNTFYDNNRSGEYSSEVAVFTYAKDGVIKNNLMQGVAARAVDIDSTCTGFSGNKNGVHGYASVENGSVLTNTLVADPQLDSAHFPTNSAYLEAGEALGGRDFYGLPYASSPAIGAVEQTSSSAITTRTIAERETEIRTTRLKAAIRA